MAPDPRLRPVESHVRYEDERWEERDLARTEADAVELRGIELIEDE